MAYAASLLIACALFNTSQGLLEIRIRGTTASGYNAVSGDGVAASALESEHIFPSSSPLRSSMPRVYTSSRADRRPSMSVVKSPVQPLFSKCASHHSLHKLSCESSGTEDEQSLCTPSIKIWCKVRR